MQVQQFILKTRGDSEHTEGRKAQPRYPKTWSMLLSSGEKREVLQRDQPAFNILNDSACFLHNSMVKGKDSEMRTCHDQRWNTKLENAG